MKGTFLIQDCIFDNSLRYLEVAEYSHYKDVIEINKNVKLVFDEGEE